MEHTPEEQRGFVLFREQIFSVHRTEQKNGAATAAAATPTPIGDGHYYSIFFNVVCKTKEEEGNEKRGGFIIGERE